MDRENNFLHDQIDSYTESRRQVEEANWRAASDAVTGLFTRQIGEGYLRIQLEDHQPVTVLMVDVSACAPVNEGTPDECEQFLRIVGLMLLEYTDIFGMICRWDAGRFLLIGAGEVNDELASGLSTRVSGADVTGHSGAADVLIGVARAGHGDKVDDVIAKAETDLNSRPNAVTATGDLLA